MAACLRNSYSSKVAVTGAWSGATSSSRSTGFSPTEGSPSTRSMWLTNSGSCLRPSSPTGKNSTEGRAALEQAEEIRRVLQDRGEAAIRTKKAGPRRDPPLLSARPTTYRKILRARRPPTTSRTPAPSAKSEAPPVLGNAPPAAADAEPPPAEAVAVAAAVAVAY